MTSDRLVAVTTILFDLDGVVRHFDPKVVRDIERRHGLASGTIEPFAFSSPLIDQVTTGRLSRADWVERIAAHVQSVEAAEEWSRQPFRVDAEVIELVDKLGVDGLTTAILTNGTDTIGAEVREMRLREHFNAIFNSADIGHAKPDARAFHAVLDALEVSPDEVFFVDDSLSKLAGAEALGIKCHLFDGVEGLREALLTLGIHQSVTP